MLEAIREQEKEAEKQNSGVREQTEENNNNEIGNLVDLYYELQENFLGQGNLREEWCHDLAKQLSYYLYSFSFFSFFFTIQEEVWESIMSQVSLGHSHMMGKSQGYVT